MLDVLRRWFRRGSADALAGLDPERTRLIVGLGNPGPEFAETRHNVGFRCVDEIARRHGAAWQQRTSDVHSLIAVVTVDDMTVVLAKPQTFMNRSGTAVSALLERSGVEPSARPIVYDDMDLPVGALRLRERGSPGTHNGMRSVVASLGTDRVARLRLGISQASPGDATGHVLGEFGRDERDAVAALVWRAADAALDWAIHGAASAMNRYNSLKT